MTRTVLVPIADGTEEIEAVCIIDVLRRAGSEVIVASIGADKSIIASRGVKLTADIHISECAGKVFDLIALPGGMPGAEHLRDSELLTEMLKHQAKAGRLYAAICASPAVVLQHHGLLENKKATSYPAMQKKLDNPQTDIVVVDGNCITSQGVGTALEFALKLVELLFDSEKANEVAVSILKA